jgi:PAS domain S-box-containing protein
MPWHAGFPLLVMAYAFFKGDNTPLAAPRGALLAAVATAIVAVLGFTLLTTAGHDLLPQLLLPDNTYTPAMLALILGVWALSLLAVLVLWLRQPHSALDLWMMVVMVAWSCDVGLSAALNAKRFDLGFYAGRAFGLMAAGFVLIILLLETHALYARLARNLSHARDAAEDRADASHRTSLEAAETLRAVVDTSNQAVIALSPKDEVLLWNKTAERMFGYSSDEVLGKPYPLVPPGTETEHRAKLARVMAGETLRHLTFRRRHKDGTERDIQSTVAPFYDASGDIRGAACALEDLTEKIATENMLRQAQKMEAVGQLTGGVAHDFNNILMVILANADELQEDKTLDASALAERVERITQAVLRASALTRQLLAFSRTQPLNPKRTDLNDLVSDTGKLLHRALGEHIVIKSTLASNLWTVNVDPTQLETALVNLCVNARDAMPGGGKLLIETRNVALNRNNITQALDVVPGDYVMLSVTDTGSGMPPETVAKVFEPFFTTKEVGKGTGLGLSMVYGFVKQSKGHITIHSEVGRGTTFRLYLPRSDGVQEEVAVRQTASAPHGTERILLVEDDPNIRIAVMQQLRSLGYKASEAPDGAAGVALCQGAEHPFDLLLTDVVMPGPLTGRELAGQVMSRWPKTKIVFMSGYSDDAILHHGKLDEGVMLLSKPFRKSDLARTLRQALDGNGGPRP